MWPSPDTRTHWSARRYRRSPIVHRRRAKSLAAEQGIPLRELVSQALAEKLGRRNGDQKPLMRHFGELRDLRKETARINRIIETEFEQI